MDDFSDLDQKQPRASLSYRQAAKRTAVTTTRREAGEASGEKRNMHGRYQQINVRILPEVADLLDQFADDFKRQGLSKENLKRWVLARGLQALRDGEMPELIKREQWEVVSPLDI